MNLILQHHTVIIFVQLGLQKKYFFLWHDNSDMYLVMIVS